VSLQILEGILGRSPFRVSPGKNFQKPIKAGHGGGSSHPSHMGSVNRKIQINVRLYLKNNQS
jgi:hypothetical protein